MNWMPEYPRRIAARRPEGHEPRAPRWRLVWDQPYSLLSSLYVGVEVRREDHHGRSEFLGVVAEARAAGKAGVPDAAELVTAETDADFITLVFVAYWKDANAFEQWMSSSSLVRWFNGLDAATLDFGAWMEIVQAPPDRVETIYSDPRYKFGLANCGGLSLQPMTLNGYFGAARDRLPASAIDPLDGAGSLNTTALQRSGLGRRLRAGVGHNTAVIRSGQYWEPASGEQLVDYDTELQPKLARGMQHLVEHADTNGTMSLRILTSVDATTLEGRRETSVLAYFRSLAQLEKWAASHPTHLDIYKHAIDMNRKYGDQRTVVTWHEVFVLTTSSRFEYVNCRAGTGLLGASPDIVEVLRD